MNWVRAWFYIGNWVPVLLFAITKEFWFCVALFPVIHTIPLYAVLRRNCQWLGPVVTRFCSDDSVWLTIDDGPSESETNAVLEVLDRHQAMATFFTIGKHMEKSPKLVDRVLDAGHSIGNHTSSHWQRWFWALLAASLRKEILEWSATHKTSLFRSPVGMKPLDLYPILKERNLTYIGWSATGLDGVSSDLDKVMARLKKQITPGCIILIHEGRGHAPALLERLLPYLEEQGLKCVLPNPEDFLTQ